MAMLAEPKRKQKWSLNPRGKEWSEDSSKFGQKLMEKMGWKSGKGLGAKLDGVTEHVRVSFKHDNKGMGYKENGEQWTEHEENFSKLLKSLGDNSEVENSDVLPQKSLEEMSAKSKKRVHYHKFTRGKDLSQYSEKQLANIFGKKTLKPKKPDGCEINETCLKNDNKKYGVDTVEGGSMVDYFKNKLGGKFKSTGVIEGGFEIGNNGVLKKVENKIDCESESDLERPSFGFGFTKNISEENDNWGVTKDSEKNSEVVKKNKKRKLRKENLDGVYDNVVFNDSLGNESRENVEENPFEVKQKKKKIKKDVPLENYENEVIIKKKKSKKYDDESIDTSDIIDNVNDEKIVKKKKKKSNKVTPLIEEDIIIPVETKIEKNKFKKNHQSPENVSESSLKIDETPAKKKSKQKQSISEEVVVKKNLHSAENVSENIVKIDETPSKKKNKSISMETSISEEVVVKKKSKKRMNLGLENPNFDLNDSNISAVDPSSEFEVKRKKKKNKKLGETSGLDNPALNVSNMSDMTEGINDASYQEGFSTSMQQNLFEGIENLALNVSGNDSIGDCSSDVIECDLMMNVAGLPNSAQRKNRLLDRSKNVRFSDNLNKEYIIPNNYQNKLLEQKLEGLSNAAFDERALTLEENMLDMEQQLSTDCAKVENDLNEVRAAAHARLLVPIIPTANNVANICHGNAGVRSLPSKQDGGGKIRKKKSMEGGPIQGEVVQDFPEVGEQESSEKHEVTPNGDIRLSYNLATLNLRNVPAHLRRVPKISDRSSYKHLIKGDIILGFNKSNLHEIVGYGTAEISGEA